MSKAFRFNLQKKVKFKSNSKILIIINSFLNFFMNSLFKNNYAQFFAYYNIKFINYKIKIIIYILSWYI